jgi:hypothetical protein
LIWQALTKIVISLFFPHCGLSDKLWHILRAFAN